MPVSRQTPSSRRANGSKPPRERRNRDAEMIVEATKIFARKGYAATSIQDVADAIGVLKGSLYHYIESKEDLLFRIFETSHAEAEAQRTDILAMDADPLTKLRAYFERYVYTTLIHLDRTSLYFREWRNLTGERLEIVLEQRKTYEAFIRGLVKDVYESGQAPVTAINPRYVSFFIIGGVHWVSDWFDEAGPDSAESVAKHYAELAVRVVTGLESADVLNGGARSASQS
jgi:AcrR family transcriptional regulator